MATVAGDDEHRRGNRVAVVPEVALSSGNLMPRVGLGTASFPLGEAEASPVVREAVLRALDAGYRHFDTAAVYGTEVAIGDAAAEAVLAGKIRSREDLYITSKLWIADAHPGHVLPAITKTLRNLRMEYVDLYLIHSPVSMRPPPRAQHGSPAVLVKEDLVAMDMKGVWEEMEECRRRGLAKAIGVSNFSCKKLEYLLSFANIPPAVNQVTAGSSASQHGVTVSSQQHASSAHQADALSLACTHLLVLVPALLLVPSPRPPTRCITARRGGEQQACGFTRGCRAAASRAVGGVRSSTAAYGMRGWHEEEEGAGGPHRP